MAAIHKQLLSSSHEELTTLLALRAMDSLSNEVSDEMPDDQAPANLLCPLLVKLLGDGNKPSVQALAAKILKTLSAASPVFEKVIVDAGAIRCLVDLLDSNSSPEVHNVAALALRDVTRTANHKSKAILADALKVLWRLSAAVSKSDDVDLKDAVGIAWENLKP